MEKKISKIFDDFKNKKMVGCKNGYMVYTKKCEAMIAIRKNDIVMSWILSDAEGAGTDMLNKLEKLSDELEKQFAVSGIINPILEYMVKKRGYKKDFVPFSPEFGISDAVEVYKRVNNG